VLFSRIVRHIESRLAEADLGPHSIASAMGISVRHVHRIFSRRGSSVADWIRLQRLSHCRSDLLDSRQRQRSITEIAFSWGFNDSAHFSRSFKEQFGECPRDFRAHSQRRSVELNHSAQIPDVYGHLPLRPLRLI
jgi:AraC family transcriptional regulator, positive regulator of tynA and feaB